jgi:Rps23 Pro-64 3,4-dihydroxylase Tpa1-like proline 4-hydroxylase
VIFIYRTSISFKVIPSRKYSMISYLNSDWKPEDGGELLIHQLNNNQKITYSRQNYFF